MGWEIKEPSVVYAIRCVKNGKVYIGRTQNLERRMREHMGDLQNKRKRSRTGNGYGPSDFQKDFDQYGESAFEVYVLEEDVPPDTVRDREAAWIADYQAANPQYGYNILGEKPACGFSCYKRGEPTKLVNESIDDKFRQLTPENQMIVAKVTEALLKAQEDNDG